MGGPAGLLLVALLIAGNAFFVIAEYSVITARRRVLAQRAEEGSRGARAAVALMDDPVRVISTVQVGITAIGILTGAVGEPVLREIVGGGLPRGVGFLIAFALITYLTVVLGELVPKAISLERAESLAALVAPPVAVIARLLNPAVWVLEGSAKLVLRPFGIDRVIVGDAIESADELRAIVDDAERTGVIPAAQEELLHNVFDFPGHEAVDVMVPAVDVVWLDSTASVDDALARVVEAAHARFPVGEGSLDRLIGIVHVRDLIAAAREGDPSTTGPLARRAYIVPETKDLGALLRELRERREQMAVVVGEYGTTTGIVTLEDILEEIVGEIEGEYELPASDLEWVGERTLKASGSMTIDDFNEAVGTTLPQDGPRTLAGLVFDAVGRAPEAGDQARFEDATVRVQEVNGARITIVRVDLATAPPPSAPRSA